MTAAESTPSNLGCAILGLLARGPRTGYDLARLMRIPVGYFWTARHSQIYPELTRLEGAGLVRHDVVPGAGPRPTKRYDVTPAGRGALRAWVASELDQQPVRDLATLRLWSVWVVEPDVARGLVLRVLELRQEALATYEAELTEVAEDPRSQDPAHPLFASGLTLEGGVRSARAAVEWCEWMLERLPAQETGAAATSASGAGAR
jgi:DNA-binding PadR family transcriptional regulator